MTDIEVEPEVIEIENILDINRVEVSRRAHPIRSGGGYNPETCKILNKSKKMVPLFSIGQEYNNPQIRATMAHNFTNHQVQDAYKRLKWDRFDRYNPDTSPYSYAFYSLVVKARQAIISALGRGYRGNRYHINIYISDKLNAMSLKEANTLLMYYVYKEKAKIEEYITGGITIDAALDSCISGGNSLTYNSFLSHFFNSSGFTIYRTRIPGLGYIECRYYIAEYNLTTGASTPLVCGMIERKHIPYFKAAQVLDDPISTDYLQLWVKEGFDHKDTLHRGLRPKYRKFIKKPLELVGVNIIERASLNDIFCVYTPPKVNSIGEYEQFLKDASIEALAEINNQLN